MNQTCTPSRNIVHAMLRQERTAKPCYYDLSRQDELVQLFEASKRLENPPNKPSCGCVNALSFSWDHSHIVSGCDNSMVQIWNLNTGQCVKTLYGHCSNVFSVLFTQSGIDEIMSGGNDADVRHYNTISDKCTVYKHFAKKVLSMTKHVDRPSVVFACSSDGTVRMFDTRVRYSHTETETISSMRWDVNERVVLPQALGGGRSYRVADIIDDSLVLNYRKSSRRSSYDLYSIDMNPTNCNQFIVGSAMGDVRLFDLRKINEHSAMDYINIYRNIAVTGNEIKGDSYDVTGCQFSYNGEQIVATFLGDSIYVFDTEKNYSQDLNIDYFNGFRGNAESNDRSMRYVIREDIDMEVSDDSDGDMFDEDEDDEEDLQFIAIMNELRNRRAQQKEEEEQQEQEEQQQTEKKESVPQETIRAYKKKYDGHVSQSTIKGVTFYGDKSQFVISGSDDGYIFIWNTATGQLLRVLEGHDETVNTICCSKYPITHPMIATSGIDDFINIWTPSRSYPTAEEMEEQQERENNIAEQNRRQARDEDDFRSNDTGFLEILREMYTEYYLARSATANLLSNSGDEQDEDESGNEEMEDNDDSDLPDQKQTKKKTMNWQHPNNLHQHQNICVEPQSNIRRQGKRKFSQIDDGNKFDENSIKRTRTETLVMDLDAIIETTDQHTLIEHAMNQALTDHQRQCCNQEQQHHQQQQQSSSTAAQNTFVNMKNFIVSNRERWDRL